MDKLGDLETDLLDSYDAEDIDKLLQVTGCWHDILTTKTVT